MPLERTAVLALIAVALGAWIALALRRSFERAARARRLARAARGEREAERVLERRGYRVVARQPRALVRYAIDGEPLDVEVRADLIVEKASSLYVAEVKTGERAPSPATPATRRQLLEYGHAFDVQGLLLVDVEADRVARVRLPERARHRPWAWLLFGVLAGAALASSLFAWTQGWIPQTWAQVWAQAWRHLT